MSDEIKGTSHWKEPVKGQRAGHGKFGRVKLPYDRFMDEEGIPCFRDVGVQRVQDLPREPWKRKGGKGTFVQLYGTEGKWGCFVVEVPGAGALHPERHLYEEIYYVIEGRGTTEVWIDGKEKKHLFEWQPGSLFSIPMNAWFRIVNASSSPAVLMAGNTAPNVLNLLKSPDAVFNNPYVFENLFKKSDDFYKYHDEIESDPVRGLAMRRTNYIPDVVNCDLPLDNRRSPGSRRIEPFMTENSFYLWIGQHENGRYSKAHGHPSAAVLICVKGKGYTYTWPEDASPTPWKNGNGDRVMRVDYEPVGMVTAAPGGLNWFHQHFGVSKEPLRLMAWYGPHAPGRTPGVPGEKVLDVGAIDLDEGGTAIPYSMEDPYIRQEYEATLKENGVETRMDPDWYKPGVKTQPAGAK